MTTSLLKFNFKTSIIKSILSEISGNFGRYYYVFGKSTPWFSIKEVTANVIGGSTTVVLTGGNTTANYAAGQVITQIGGDGKFGVNATINSIISETEFEANVDSLATGAVVFNIDEENAVEDVSDLYDYENKTRNDFLFYKQVNASDVAPVVIRHNWVSGIVYDMYREYSEDDPAFSGSTALETATFYVVTDQYNVYKCLDNNNNGVSIRKPIGTSTAPIETDDGYIWKYMYTIPISLRNKFMSSTLMPVVNSLASQFYSKGSIVSYAIESAGAKYSRNNYKVSGFIIHSGGSGYETAPTITIENSHQDLDNASVAEVTITDGRVTAIMMDQVGSGYSYPPQFTIEGGLGTNGVSAILEPIIELVDNNKYTRLVVSGDGRLEENPYEVESIDILNGGSGYDSITLLFADPDLPNGVKAAATVVLDETGKATDITIDNPGYGYSSPFITPAQDLSGTSSNIVRFSSTSIAGTTGSGFQYKINVKKNEAVLEPIIDATTGAIEQVQVVKPGIGYTYASVNVETDLDTENTNDFQKASILLNLGIGTIESSQSTTELTAVAGAIHAVHIANAGSGYNTPVSIEIVGDGTGATAEVIRSAYGTIQKIVITNPGYGYTYAEAVLKDDQGNTPAVVEEAQLKVVLPPQGGHGKDAISELYCKSLTFRTLLFKDRIFSTTLSNSFRQVCLVKNPKYFDKDSYLRLGTASTCQMLYGTKDQASYNDIQINDEMSDSSGNRYIIVQKYPDIDDVNDALLVSYQDNVVLSAGATISKTLGASAISFSINSTLQPNVNKFSGEMLTTDNRVKFTPSEDQIVVASNTITF